MGFVALAIDKYLPTFREDLPTLPGYKNRKESRKIGVL
jgi:hypothetical protein